MAAKSDRPRNVLLGIAGLTTLAVIGYLLWGEVQFENARREVREFCDALRVQESQTQIQLAVGLSTELSMLLMEATPDGQQIGSIYSENASGISCNVTFMRGRLQQKSFGGGRIPGVNGAPAEKLKSW